MNALLVAGALLVLGIGLAHSYLGEKYILVRLFRRDNLPRLFGGDEFTKRTLRFAWHLTSVAWWGLGAILLVLSQGPIDSPGRTILRIVAAIFAVHGGVALVASRGRHLSWIVFGAIAALVWIASGG